MTAANLTFLVRPALSGLAFLVSFCVVCFAIRESLPFPAVPVVQSKIEYLQDHVNEFDVLFLGSSRMYHQIIPSLFDELLSKQGVAVRSFNIGVDGMRPPEDAYVFDQVRAMKPQRLRFVFIEAAGLRLPVDEDKRDTIRALYWHDWERLRLLLSRAMYQKKKRDLTDTIRELREPMSAFFAHLELFAKNVTNAGRSDVLTRHLRTRTQRTTQQINRERVMGKSLDGYVPADFPEVMPPEALASYRRELGERQTKPAVEDLADPVSQKAMQRLLAAVRSIGATPVLVIPPTTNKKNFYPRPELRGDLLIFDYSDINKYAGLYENQHRQDTDHVNKAGAVVFTEILAKEFAAVVQSRK
jgi:hypothetical protein